MKLNCMTEIELPILIFQVTSILKLQTQKTNIINTNIS